MMCVSLAIASHSLVSSIHMQILKYYILAEPDRQFILVKDHIMELRKNLKHTLSKVKIYVERNLGFEAEHHHRALGDLPGVEFYVVTYLSHTISPTISVITHVVVIAHMIILDLSSSNFTRRSKKSSFASPTTTAVSTIAFDYYTLLI
jgi:hypothetical protein